MFQHQFLYLKIRNDLGGLCFLFLFQTRFGFSYDSEIIVVHVVLISIIKKNIKKYGMRYYRTAFKLIDFFSMLF